MHAPTLSTLHHSLTNTGPVAAMVASAVAKGIRLEDITEHTGLSLTDLVQPGHYVRDEAVVGLLHFLLAKFPDRAIALELGMQAPLSFFGAVGKAARHAEDLRGAILTFVRYGTLLSRRFRLELEEARGEARMTMHHTLDDLCPTPAPELATALSLRFHREIVGGCEAPQRVEFQHERMGPLSVYTEFFGCEVLFGRTHNSVVLHPQTLRRPTLHADRYRYAALERGLELRLESTSAGPSGGALTRIREAIARNARRGEYGAEALAKRLGMSLRSVERAVGAEGTTVRKLLDQTRESHARRLLEEPGPTIDEITSLLGYSAASAFRRAFKRWSGITPAEYRRRRSADD